MNHLVGKNMLGNLNRYKILLASKSPRRRELLKMLDVPFEIAPSIDVEEKYPEALPSEQIPEYLACLKADAYASMVDTDTLIITADTVVILDGEVIGKPADASSAVEMLLHLSGREHRVVTGVCITSQDRRDSFSVRSDVRFAPITREAAEYYVRKYKPLDKAGAYGIQEWIGAVAVESISGSFYNVMGLPVHQLFNRLSQF